MKKQLPISIKPSCDVYMKIMWNGQEKRRELFFTDYNCNGRHVLSATGVLRLVTSKCISTDHVANVI